MAVFWVLGDGLIVRYDLPTRSGAKAGQWRCDRYLADSNSLPCRALSTMRGTIPGLFLDIGDVSCGTRAELKR
ncbi:hypothetical protein GJ744_012078 [Endocarpon pusillum]|uniref:Uncharacterized protein n=1 Tax=Endocarpon pusillum TaxID=364733 RepID=A0A8H7AJH4_9EURO|nr:hypothetical protein GJ744_012078 [Endocarpon pusillum]